MLDTGTYTSNLGVGATTSPQIIGNPTPTVRTLPPKILKTTLPPQYKTNTLPPRVVRVNLPPVGPVGGAVSQSFVPGIPSPSYGVGTKTTSLTQYDVNGDGIPDVNVKNVSYDYNGDGVPDRKVQVITGAAGLPYVPGGVNVDLNRDGLNDFKMGGGVAGETFVAPQPGAQYL